MKTPLPQGYCFYLPLENLLNQNGLCVHWVFLQYVHLIFVGLVRCAICDIVFSVALVEVKSALCACGVRFCHCVPSNVDTAIEMKLAL